MNVILLLSALLSALTGVDAGVARSPVAAERVAARAAAVAEVLAPAGSARAPLQGFDIRAARRWQVPLVRLPRLELPAFADRRRE